MAKKMTTRQRLYKHRMSAARVTRSIRIRKSTIALAGAGAFIEVSVTSGTCLGYYAGCRLNKQQVEQLPFGPSRDYVMQDSFGHRDAYDAGGRLEFEDGSVKNVHQWSPNDWKAALFDGIVWRGVYANWTRFINHTSSAYRNVAICTTSERYGRSHAMYATRPISAGEELFFDYGSDYWTARNVTPGDPET